MNTLSLKINVSCFLAPPNLPLINAHGKSPNIILPSQAFISVFTIIQRFCEKVNTYKTKRLKIFSLYLFNQKAIKLRHY